MEIERSIRRGQAIYPYGPGSILDWGQECFVVLGTNVEENRAWLDGRPITLDRLADYLGASEGFRLPPVGKAFGSKPGAGKKILVQRFPRWLFCPKCGRMWKWTMDKEDGETPTCRRSACREIILVPMRYIGACSNGHLADIDWHRWVHLDSGEPASPCDPRKPKLKYNVSAGKLSKGAIEIHCETCGKKANLSNLHNDLRQKCFGTQPWQNDGQAEDCDEMVRPLMKSSMAVHMPRIVSALDIRVSEETGDVRQKAIEAKAAPHIAAGIPFQALVGMAPNLTANINIDFSKDHPGAPPITKEEVIAWLKRNNPVPATAGSFPSADGASASRDALLLEEWPVLTSTTAVSDKRNASIIVKEETVGSEGSSFGIDELLDGVFLVERLREVRAFSGFHRAEKKGLVYPDCQTRRPPLWYPAVEVFGEGIFLRFRESALKRWETDEEKGLSARFQCLNESEAWDDTLFHRFEAEEPIPPRFVLVHTFSHLLIRQFCYECGYHAASLRERLYVFGDKAGVLIYTADGDSEGSLGGLVRQGYQDRLAKTILSALERGAWCSNDPICQELPNHGPANSIRAACHGCALLAETSCTEGNGLLDRQLVLGDGSGGVGGVTGYFWSVLERSFEES